MSHRSKACDHNVSHIIVRRTQLTIPKEVKPWHKATPLLIMAATILGLIVIVSLLMRDLPLPQRRYPRHCGKCF
jgi:hypothetical protein